jgi:hypothetical protein
MPIIACPHCGTKLNGPDSVLGKEVICGQCQKRFIAAAETPFGSQYARPAPPRASRETGFESMESLTPGPAQEPLPAPQPQPSQPQFGPEASAPGAVFGGPSQPAGAPQAPPPVPPPASLYGPGPMPGQPYGPYPPYGILPRASGAGAALTLGIISIVGGCCCGPVGLVCAILAIIFGGNAIRDIDAGRADPIDRGKANTGRICGIIGLILSLLGIIFWIFSVLADGGHWNMGDSPF